jgi:hypothetical protein
MTRITAVLKDAIIKNAVAKSGVTAELEAIKTKRLSWAERVRIEVVGGPEKAAEYAKINAEALVAYSALPQEMKDHSNIVGRRSSFYVNLAGLSVAVKLNGYSEAPNNRMSITAASPLCQEFHDIEAEEKTAVERGTIIENQVRATLDKFGTIKRLVEAWPEVAELLPPMTAETKSNLPAIQVADLNKLVGLPSEEVSQ